MTPFQPPPHGPPAVLVSHGRQFRVCVVEYDRHTRFCDTCLTVLVHQVTQFVDANLNVDGSSVVSSRVERIYVRLIFFRYY